MSNEKTARRARSAMFSAILNNNMQRVRKALKDIDGLTDRQIRRAEKLAYKKFAKGQKDEPVILAGKP